MQHQLQLRQNPSAKQKQLSESHHFSKKIKSSFVENYREKQFCEANAWVLNIQQIVWN